MQAKPVQLFAVADVWAAACAAQRVNGQYIKDSRSTYNEDGSVASTTRRNRDVMLDFLTDPALLQDQDREQGQRVRQFIQNDLTLRALKGRLTEFDTAASRCVAVEDQFNSNLHRYELAVIAALPSSVERTQTRNTADQRLRWAQGGPIGKIADKITARVEIVSAVFSQNYNCWFLRGLTDQDQPVMFSYRSSYDAGTWLTVRGTVKAHREHGLTQLNRVRVV